MHLSRPTLPPPVSPISEAILQCWCKGLERAGLHFKSGHSGPSVASLNSIRDFRNKKNLIFWIVTHASARDYTVLTVQLYFCPGFIDSAMTISDSVSVLFLMISSPTPVLFNCLSLWFAILVLIESISCKTNLAFSNSI